MGRIRIEGYTDNVGPPDMNVKLSRERADVGARGARRARRGARSAAHRGLRRVASGGAEPHARGPREEQAGGICRDEVAASSRLPLLVAGAAASGGGADVPGGERLRAAAVRRRRHGRRHRRHAERRRSRSISSARRRARPAFTPPTRSSCICACASPPIPRKARGLRPNGWGFEIDLDGDRSTYELLISVSGTGATDQVAIFRHPTTTVADSPADPAVLPAAFSYPFATHGKITRGRLDARRRRRQLPRHRRAVDRPRQRRHRARHAGVHLGRLVDGGQRARPRSGLLRRRRRRRSSGIDVGVTAPDPSAPGGGGGGGGTGGGNDGGTGGTGPRTLEGGPGCSFAAAGAPACGWLAFLFFFALALRRARS